MILSTGVKVKITEGKFKGKTGTVKHLIGIVYPYSYTVDVEIESEIKELVYLGDELDII